MKKKIIIADDNKALCDFMYKHLLKFDEFEILGIANTDEDEINLIEEKKPDIVITDLMRNEKYTGFDIIKEYSTHKYSPQFLIISAGMPVSTIMKCQNVAGYINKLGLDYNRLVLELRSIVINDTIQIKDKENEIKKYTILEKIKKFLKN